MSSLLSAATDQSSPSSSRYGVGGGESKSNKANTKAGMQKKKTSLPVPINSYMAMAGRDAILTDVVVKAQGLRPEGGMSKKKKKSEDRQMLEFTFKKARKPSEDALQDLASVPQDHYGEMMEMYRNDSQESFARRAHHNMVCTSLASEMDIFTPSNSLCIILFGRRAR